MEVTRVTVDEVSERLNRGERFAFVDTRNPQAWAQADQKLPGAINMGFADGHTELVKLEDLWNYYWHLDWDASAVARGN